MREEPVSEDPILTSREAGAAAVTVGARDDASIDQTAGTHRLSNAATRSGIVLVSHTAVDVYSAIVPPIIGVLEVRCELNAWQTASLLGVGSVSSGLSQPIAAWLSDRFDTRVFGALGLVLAASCVCFIGAATNYGQLLALFIVGMIGVGIYHPVGASSIGQLADGGVRSRRSIMLSVFFVAGMIGGTAGSIASPAITGADGGFDALRWLMVPGLVIAIILQIAIWRVPHRHEHHRSIVFEPMDLRHRWTMISILYVSSAMRFTVNIALFYLYVRWAQGLVIETDAALVDATQKQIAEAGAPISGRMIGATTVGMAVGGLTAGAVMKAGREKWPMVLVPILFAPIIIMLPHLNEAGATLCAALAGIGFASMIPVSLGLAQRLLPHRTSLASGLMLGGAWWLAVTGPFLSEWCMASIGLTIEQTFIVIATLLAISGLVCIMLDRQLLIRTAN